MEYITKLLKLGYDIYGEFVIDECVLEWNYVRLYILVSNGVVNFGLFAHM